MPTIFNNYGNGDAADTPPLAPPVAGEKDAEKGETDNNLVSRERPPTTGTQNHIERDKYVVDWDGPDDPQKPTNWSSRKKWKNLLIVNTITLITYVLSACTSTFISQSI